MGFVALGMLFWLIGIITAILLFLAPIITFKKIIGSKSTQEFSGIPYALTLLNCLVTGWYTAVSLRGNFAIFIVNIAGAALELIYVIIFLVFAEKRERGKIGAILALVLSLFGAIALISVFVFFRIARLFCGFAVSMSAIAMYASPFSVMRMVIRTKSTEFMPFFLSFFMLLYASSWFIFGLFEGDFFLLVPNGLGTILCIIQLILYARYRNNSAEKYKFSTGALDIGLSQAQLNKQPDLEIPTNRPI